MDVGFALCTVSLSAGYYEYAIALQEGVIGRRSGLTPFIKALYWVGAWLLSLGDVSSVIFITVMSFIFYRLAAASRPIDVMVYLPWGLALALITGLVVAIAEVTVCSEPTFLASCAVVRVRGSISLLCVAINCTLSFAVSRILKRMPEGLRKEAVKGLSSRILLYTGWVTISRLSYIYLSLETGSMNLNFADAAHLKFTNFMSTLTYLMWLPSGTGFAIIYLYTHPEEARYVWDFFRMRKDVCWLPADLHDTYYAAVDNMCCCLPARCTGLYPITDEDHLHRDTHGDHVRPSGLGMSKSSSAFAEWAEHREDSKADIRVSNVMKNATAAAAAGGNAGGGGGGGVVYESTIMAPLYDAGMRDTTASAGLARSTGVSRQQLSTASGLRNTDGGMSISDLTAVTGLSFASDGSAGGGLRGTTASAAAAGESTLNNSSNGGGGGGQRSSRRRGRGAGDTFAVMKPQSEDAQLHAWAEEMQAECMRDTGGNAIVGQGLGLSLGAISGNSSRTNSAASLGGGVGQSQSQKKATGVGNDDSGNIL